MNLKTILITIFLASCVVLMVNGTWKVAVRLVEFKREKARLQEFANEGVYDNGTLNSIRNNMILSGLIAFSGCLGLFIFISKTSRKPVHKSINEKQS